MMNIVGKIFSVGLHQVLRDGMLLMMLPAPFLMGVALMYLLPFINSILVREYGFALTPWYGISDALVMALTPIMIAMVCAFIILDERDEGVGTYYRVTPSGGKSYLVARIGLPMIWAFFISVLVILLFGLVLKSIYTILALTVIATLQGVISCMLLVSLAANKVEGLALAKLANLFIVGLPVPWFIDSQYRYIFSILPSFWMGEIIKVTSEGLPFLLSHLGFGIAAALLWIVFLMRLFIYRTY